MQITPGQTTLSLAMLKALGSQAAAPAKASPAPATASSATASPPGEPRAGLPGGDGAAARHLPRGSFVDLRA